MAEYKPDAATEAALAKSRSGKKLSTSEQQLLMTHSQRFNAQDSGGYGNYGASNGGSTGSRSEIGTDGQRYFLPDTVGDSYAKYQNFLRVEAERKAEGLPPRPVPSTFTQFGASSPAGVMNIKSSPVVDRMGVAVNSNVLKYQPVLPPTYGGYDGQRTTTGVTAPTPQANPGLPQTAGETTQLPFNSANALPSAPMTIRKPNGGLELGNSVAGIDEGKILAEAELQKDLARQTNDQQGVGRKAMLDDLAALLQKQQAGAMNDMMPGVYEDLNTRGLLRSSALGEKVGLESAKLSRQTAEQLAHQGLSDRGKTIDALGSIEDAYLGQRNSALGRRFSLEDFDRQLAAGKALGSTGMPTVSQGSGKGSSALQGGLGGATIGAQVGGPTGAVAGGVIGAIGGGKLGSK